MSKCVKQEGNERSIRFTTLGVTGPKFYKPTELTNLIREKGTLEALIFLKLKMN